MGEDEYTLIDSVYECTECGAELAEDECDFDATNSPYCPVCGAEAREM
jgi:rubrerythrin